MADKRDARRKRILENSCKRLEKLENVKLSSRYGTGENMKIKPEILKCDKTQSSHDEDFKEQIKERKNIQSKGVNEEKKHPEEPTSLNESVTKPENEDLVTSSVNWVFGKRKLILFVLLAWVIYMIVEKDLDILLAYIYSHKLSKETLDTMVLVSFIGVELQLVLADLIINDVKQDSSFSYIIFMIELCGVRKSVINKFKRIMTILSNILTDFCVYLFTLVYLHAMDGKL